jgi:hypothetical protein
MRSLQKKEIARLILPLFPSANGILLFGSQHHLTRLSPRSDIDLMVVVPLARIRHLHNFRIGGFRFDINLIPEINFDSLIYLQSATLSQSSLVDGVLTGDIIYDKDDMLAAFKDLCEHLHAAGNFREKPETILAMIAIAQGLADDIHHKPKTLAQFLQVGLLFEKLIDIETTVNLDMHIIGRKFKTRKLKLLNPGLYKQLEEHAYRLDQPDYIENIYAFSNKILKNYASTLHRRGIERLSYLRNAHITIEFDTQGKLNQFLAEARSFLKKKKLSGIRYYYLLRPFRLSDDFTNRVVLYGKGLKALSAFTAAYLQDGQPLQPARSWLIAKLYGGLTTLAALEDLLTRMCHLVLDGCFEQLDRFMIGLYIVLCIGQEAKMRKPDLSAFLSYLFETWLCMSYDGVPLVYAHLPDVREKTLTDFGRLLQENKQSLSYIKALLSKKVQLDPWQHRIAKIISKFVIDKRLSSANFTVPVYEIQKLSRFTPQPTKHQHWFLYRKALELLLFNLAVDEKDFSFVAFLLHSSIS